MAVSILALSTALPPFAFAQTEVAEKIIEMLAIPSLKGEKIRELYKNSAIDKRYSVIEDFKKERSDWKFWGKNFPQETPGMSQRNAVYKNEAPKLAYQAAIKAIKQWGGEAKNITHIISVTCTGMVAPGLEFELMQSLKLSSTTQRLGINFMGCFGAFKGIAVAQALAKENDRHRILVVCTELCSLHFQAALTPDNILGNALFSDGAAALIIGANPLPSERILWDICHNASLALNDTTDKMRWEAGDSGYLMKLSHTVPVLLSRQIVPFIETLLDQRVSQADCDWAIHPGGKSIIQAVQKALKIDKKETIASWDTLANYGNMSSATFLFVLERLLELKSTKKWTVGVGFGPGLSIEGLLLKRVHTNEE